ncbi:hypothetical protein [Nesterenkonia xinjiangensis]|uniref:Uncharacterized protein n=1 Tax=Nesterenkonia xinjiangensis TaxID=225327 RepID=A0A7Z0GLD3_9MICC|nr:hypothetical protein [Nesterenkonia xinjiangensis]NYJ76993.1 hypothetical protein [Nesterenkonia xinjiangensis]
MQNEPWGVGRVTMIGRRLRRMRLMLAVCAAAAVVSLCGILAVLFGHDTAGLVILLLATQGLIAGCAVVLHRAVLRTRTRSEEGRVGEPRPEISPEDVIEGVREQLEAHGGNEQRLARLLEQQEAAQTQLRRRLFQESFSPDASRAPEQD